MPELCRFYGIVIRMFFNDHEPAHFHATYGEEEALIIIETKEVYAGELPSRALDLVKEWALLHQDELLANWNAARQGRPLQAIAPLK